ncbi:MAG TPA: oxygenase MpaB family protein [Ohtaekwangia sp.]
MEYFVDKQSVVRRIWGKSDTILFIFAGASAEFALNKAVDWLYFTGRLPLDPIGRLFSTVSYARAIVFSEKKAALRAIDSMASIHANVESKRGVAIPDWAYRDVLFLLIDYSIRSFETLDRKMTRMEKEEVFQVFISIGNRMELNGLPQTFDHWNTMRQEHLKENLQHSHFTDDLFQQYYKHLGTVRFRVLLETQKLMVPSRVRELLGLRRISLLHPVISLYKMSRSLKLDWILRSLILPARYKQQIMALDK